MRRDGLANCGTGGGKVDDLNSLLLEDSIWGIATQMATILAKYSVR